LREKALASLNLGVQVRGRTATLWGLVPSASFSLTAERILRSVPGLTGVRNETRVDPSLALDEGLSSPASVARTAPLSEPVIPQPPRVQESVALRPGSTPIVPSLESRWRPATVRPSDPAAPSTTAPEPRWRPKRSVADSPLPADKEKRDTTSILSSRPRAASPPRLIEAIDALRLADPRFHGLQLEVNDGVVSLRGKVARFEYVYELTRSIAQIAGVKRVVVEDVRTAVSP
jgi:hypothetical protein